MRRDNRGFTLIELLIVVVIIGLLAAIAIPKFASTKEQAYVGLMRGDLRNLATAQTAHEADHGSFYDGPIPAGALVYAPSTSVSIVLSNVTGTGWAATASHSGTTRTCAIYLGTGGPVGPATVEGLVACT
jgi:prepilin-type N-terminal cleavage/methylation domain-containing protein